MVPSESEEAAEENWTFRTGLPTAGVVVPEATGVTLGWADIITGTVAVVVRKSSSVTVRVAL